MNSRHRWHAQLTDTFAGEANYAWCRNHEFTMPADASQAAVMRAAKAGVGLSGSRGRTTTNGGDGYEFRPFGACVVLFVSFGGDVEGGAE